MQNPTRNLFQKFAAVVFPDDIVSLQKPLMPQEDSPDMEGQIIKMMQQLDVELQKGLETNSLQML